MSSSEVEAAHVPAAPRLKKKNGICAMFGRHAIYFRFCSMRSTGVKEDKHNNSRCFKKCDNTKFSLDSAEIVGLRVQQPPKEQVATETEKERTAATVVTCYAVFPEERIEPEYCCLAHIWGKYLHKVTLLLKYGPPPPVKATLKNQVETPEVPPSNAGFQLWKFLIRDNHQPVRPWSTTTNGANGGPRRRFSGNYSGHG
jgi:hypothetical protein